MSVEITKFVNANISISPTGVGLGNFGILGFLTNEAGILPVQRTKSYGSIQEVLSDWSTTTEVYKAAATFYGQTPTPTDFVVMAAYETDQAAMILGGQSATVGEFVLQSAATFTVEVSGVSFTTAAMDFSGATTFADVATILTAGLVTAVAGVTVAYNGTQFVMTTDLLGVAATLVFPAGSLADDLGFSQALGVVSQGLDSESPVQALGQAIEMGTDITALVTHKKYRDQVAITSGHNTEDIADFCEAAKIIFCNTTNNLTALDSVITSDVGSLLKNKSLKFSITSFAKNFNQYPSAFVFGRAASVNFEGIDTTITLNLKQAATITAEDLTTSELAVLESKNINVVVQIGKQATGFTNSRMANNSWLDSVHGLLWLENRIEVDMFNTLYTTATKIPYNAFGINVLINTLENSLEQGVRNGLLTPGFLPDGTYLPNGYVVENVDLADVSKADKTNRVYKGLKFKCVGAGALHEVAIDGEFSE